MELIKFIGLLATVLPLAYGAPTAGMSDLQPEMLAAMKRDLGLDAEQATARVAREVSASSIIDQLKITTGSAFAGAWVANDGKTINVGVTDKALAKDVKAAGAKPVILANSMSKLEDAKKALDKLVIEPKADVTKRAAAEGVASWWIDVTTNKLVLEALADSTASAEDLATSVGLTESEYEVRTVGSMPETFATVQGGNAYLISGTARCSVGFSVTTGFVSAGHCGRTGASATTTSGQSLGTFSGSVFPGSADMSYIRTVSGTTLSGTINSYGGSALRVAGSTASAVGSSICRSGSTTGVSCGTVRSLGATVNYSEGSVTGLTQTNVCAEPGDSGGSFYTGTQAQGVTSGGSGDCSRGGITYFQPVNEILSTYGLTLVRG